VKIWKFVIGYLAILCLTGVACIIEAEYESRLMSAWKLIVVYPDTGLFAHEKIFVRLDKKTISGHDGSVWPVRLFEKDDMVVMKEKTIIGQGGVIITFTLPADDQEIVFFRKYFPEPPIIV